MPKLPNFQTEDELVKWFDTHDTGPYMDEMEPSDQEFPIILTEFVTRPVDLRLRADFFTALETLAAQRGIPYQMLIQTWLREKLAQEAPNLLPHHT